MRWLEKANRRIHGTTRERPILRFEEERYLLRPLAPRPYQSLVLPQVSEPAPPTRRVVTVPVVSVERRPLAAYTALVAGAA